MVLSTPWLKVWSLTWEKYGFTLWHCKVDTNCTFCGQLRKQRENFSYFRWRLLMPISQSEHNMGPLMDLHDYLSMAWFRLPCCNACCFSLCLFRSSFFLSSLDGKKESTVTGALSTSTTVRPHCFLLTTCWQVCAVMSSPNVRRTDERVCVVVFVSRHKEHTVGGPSPAESSHHRTCE